MQDAHLRWWGYGSLRAEALSLMLLYSMFSTIDIPAITAHTVGWAPTDAGVELFIPKVQRSANIELRPHNPVGDK